jgi:eukaryotic-like serine/threonine-protein kinase
VPPPEKATLSSDQAELHNLALSPDGSRIAFVASLEGQSRIWVRPLDALSATPLAGTEGASSPFWSPDGAFLGFFAETKLKTIAVAGFPAQTVCPTAGANSGAWGPTGTILFTQAFSPKDGLYSVPASGGEPRQITGDSGDFSGGRWPRFLPDGRRFLFLSWNAKEKTKFLVSGELGSPEIRRVAPLRSRVEISGAGDLFYVREGVLVARAFDSSTLRFTGEPVPVAERIPYFSPTGWAPFSVSENGVVAYQAGAAEAPLRLLDRKGQTVATLGPPGEYSSVRLSPDGRKAAVEKIDPATGLSDLWIADLSREVMTRFTADPGSESSPIWSPDGAEIAFVSHGVASPTLRRKRLDDTSNGEVLVKEGFPTPSDWSRDGRFIAFNNLGSKTGFDMWLLPLSGDLKPQLFRQTPFNEGLPAFSPDGRWVAFLSDESAVPQMYVTSSSGSGPKWQVSSGGGVALGRPRWRGDGKELFHEAADRQLMSVPVKTDASTFEPGSPVPLFRIDSESMSGYDVSADGQRFLTSSGIALGSQPITVLLNWRPTGRSR